MREACTSGIVSRTYRNGRVEVSPVKSDLPEVKAVDPELASYEQEWYSSRALQDEFGTAKGYSLWRRMVVRHPELE